MVTKPVTYWLHASLGSPFKRTLAAVLAWSSYNNGAHSVLPIQGSTMSRRPHPYFGRINRGEEVRKLEPGQRNACEPLAKPRDEPGILWDAFRDEK